MKRITTRILLASALLFTITALSFAQAQPQWKVGDRIEVRNMSSEWVRASIVGIVDWRDAGRGFGYRVKVDDQNAPNVYWTAPAETVRALPGLQEDTPADVQPVANPKPANGAAFKVGDRVDTFYDENRGHNRGTVIEVKEGKYKVHYTGCAKTWDEWVDRTLVLPAATISKGEPEIQFLIGRWSLTQVAVGHNNVFWGKTKGLQINADGTYVWFQDGGAPPVKGEWVTDAKVPKLNAGTPMFNGIIVKDATGQEWKAFKWVVKNSNDDAIELDRMCLGVSEVGTRVR